MLTDILGGNLDKAMSFNGTFQWALWEFHYPYAILYLKKKKMIKIFSMVKWTTVS